MSHGVVGLLDQATEERVRALRRRVSELVGEASLDALPLPHLSLVVGQRVDEDAAGHGVRDVASTLARTPFHAEPWTLFLAPSPSVGCAVVRSAVRTPELDAMRSAVAAAVEPSLGDISRYTTTATWNPHVTLASQGVEPGQLGAVVDLLVEAAEEPWEGHLERVALVVEEGPRHRLAMAVELKG
jgi:2'-5' RNA ligase